MEEELKQLLRELKAKSEYAYKKMSEHTPHSSNYLAWEIEQAAFDFSISRVEKILNKKP